MTGTIKELEQITLAVGDEISSADVVNRIPEQWGKEVENRAMPKRVFRNYMVFNDDLTRNPGSSIKIPKKTIIDYETYAPTLQAELTAISPNVELQFDTVEFHPKEMGLAAAVTKQAIEQAFVSVMEQTVDNIASAYAQKEDIDCVAGLVATTVGQEIKAVEADATAVGGDFNVADWTVAKAAGTQSNITPADVLDLNVIAEASDVIMPEAGFEADTLFIHPRQKAALMRDKQFLEVAKSGDNQMFRKGVIGSVYGLDVVVSRNVPKITISDGDSGTATGYQAIMIDSTAAAGLAYSRNATIETEYRPLERKHYIVLTAMYEAKRLNDGAVIAINTA